jgi:hypothetical protein
MNAKIQRLPNGDVLGAVLWIPSSFIGNEIEIEQEEIEFSFVNNKTKDEDELNISMVRPFEFFPRIRYPFDRDRAKKIIQEMDASEAYEKSIIDKTADMLASTAANSVTAE